MTAISERQPSGLYLLAFVEMWERFGFYTIQFLLTLYLSYSFGFSDQMTNSLTAAYGALIFLSPVIGGYIAERWLGYRYAIIVGACLFILGYAGLAWQASNIVRDISGLQMALACLILGNGFFKGNVSSFLGCLYQSGDIKRASGFTLFYMGFNIGSTLGLIICPFLKAQYGYSVVFTTASSVMLMSLAAIIWGCRHLMPGLGLPPKKLTMGVSLGVMAGIVVCGIAFYHMLLAPVVVSACLLVLAISAILYSLMWTHHNEPTYFRRLCLLFFLMIFSVLFWAQYWQFYTSIIFFIERCVDKTVWHWHLQSEQFGSLVGFFVVAFSPLFAWFWLRLAKAGYEISNIGKFGLALFLSGVAFLPLYWVAAYSTGFAAAGWVVSAFALIVAGELCLSPIGLSLVTEQAPPQLTSVIMGIWFITLSAGFAFGGNLANMADIAKGVTDLTIIKNTYAHLFGMLTIGGLVIGLTLMLLTKRLQKWADGSR